MSGPLIINILWIAALAICVLSAIAIARLYSRFHDRAPLAVMASAVVSGLLAGVLSVVG